jgi:hypothetical protein
MNIIKEGSETSSQKEDTEQKSGIKINTIIN